MTRFDAATESARKELFVDAIAAHDERGSRFLTIEVDAEDFTASEETNEDDEPEPVPWIQFADGIVNVDCADDELGRMKSLLGDYSEFRIEELTRPEDSEGINLRIAARTDPARVAEFIDRAFIETYDRPPGYRAWVTAV